LDQLRTFCALVEDQETGRANERNSIGSSSNYTFEKRKAIDSLPPFTYHAGIIRKTLTCPLTNKLGNLLPQLFFFLMI